LYKKSTRNPQLVADLLWHKRRSVSIVTRACCVDLKSDALESQALLCVLYNQRNYILIGTSLCTTNQAQATFIGILTFIVTLINITGFTTCRILWTIKDDDLDAAFVYNFAEFV